MVHRTMRKGIYLAGPDVLLINASEVGVRKRAICAPHGLVGVFPAGEETALPEQGPGISRAVERVMRGCYAMIVNLTRFRGPIAGVGSAFEMESRPCR
jgi:nucleoside 2-deoxyribosyltransferase